MIGSPGNDEFINVNGLWLRKSQLKVFRVFTTSTTTVLYCPFLGADGATAYQVPAGKKLRLLGAHVNFFQKASGVIANFCYGDNAVSVNGSTAPTNQTGFPEIGTSVAEEKSAIQTTGLTAGTQVAMALPQWEIPAQKYPHLFSYQCRMNAIIYAQEV